MELTSTLQHLKYSHVLASIDVNKKKKLDFWQSTLIFSTKRKGMPKVPIHEFTISTFLKVQFTASLT
jgi:hypothetical protein